MSRHVVLPWELALLQRQLEELFDALARPREAPGAGWTPPVDLIDRRDAVVARIDLPGVRREDIDIVLNERELHVSGARPPREPESAPRRCHRVERSFGPFALHLHLPAPVDPAACRASLRAGVLEITLPRPPEKTHLPHRVEISEEEP